jgi:hypothetical protein
MLLFVAQPYRHECGLAEAAARMNSGGFSAVRPGGRIITMSIRIHASKHRKQEPSKYKPEISGKRIADNREIVSFSHKVSVCSKEPKQKIARKKR